MNLAVQITANAPRNQIVGWLGDRLKVKVKAPAVEGKANAELLRFLSEKLDVRLGCLQILKGETAKFKLISIQGLEPSQLHDKLGQKA
jgi:uncharacterized protein (TIGR00251 family)